MGMGYTKRGGMEIEYEKNRGSRSRGVQCVKMRRSKMKTSEQNGVRSNMYRVKVERDPGEYAFACGRRQEMNSVAHETRGHRSRKEWAEAMHGSRQPEGDKCMKMAHEVDR